MHQLRHTGAFMLLSSAKLVCLRLCSFFVALRDAKSCFCRISFLSCVTFFCLLSSEWHVWFCISFCTFSKYLLVKISKSKRSPQTTQDAAYAGKLTVGGSQEQIDQSAYRLDYLHLCLPLTWLFDAVTEKFPWMVVFEGEKWNLSHVWPLEVVFSIPKTCAFW